MTDTAPTAPAAPLPVGAREQALIGPEIAAFLAGVRDAATRADYAALADAVAAGAVEGPALARLEAFLELLLTTGRVRQRQGLHNEDILRRLYERTPRGAAQAASAAEVTRALASLVGQSLADLQLSQVRPGTYRLVLETDRYRVSIGLAPAGAHVESVELTL